MGMQELLVEKIKRFEDMKNQISELQQKIGGMQEQQRALYNQGLEMKGAIDALLQMKAEEEKALANSKTASLILPEGVKPIVPEPTPAPQNDAPVAPVAEVAPTAGPTEGQPHAEKQPVILEVK